MSLLDDENILIDDIRNESFKKIHCDKLGNIYMTKQGVFGYVWDITADGTPKILMRVSSEPINLQYLFDLKDPINKFEKNEGWYIPTKEQFLKSLSWVDPTKYQPTIIDDIIKRVKKLEGNGLTINVYASSEKVEKITVTLPISIRIFERS